MTGGSAESRKTGTSSHVKPTAAVGRSADRQRDVALQTVSRKLEWLTRLPLLVGEGTECVNDSKVVPKVGHSRSSQTRGFQVAWPLLPVARPRLHDVVLIRAEAAPVVYDGPDRPALVGVDTGRARLRLASSGNSKLLAWYFPFSRPLSVLLGPCHGYVERRLTNTGPRVPRDVQAHSGDPTTASGDSSNSARELQQLSEPGELLRAD